MAVCSTCNDTHRMRLSKDGDVSREVMCTRCPAPCQQCRAGVYGAFCETTPCACKCHDGKRRDTEVDARIRTAVRAALDEVAGELRRRSKRADEHACRHPDRAMVATHFAGVRDGIEEAARIVEARRDRDG